MKASKQLYETLRKEGLDFFVSVPCRLLKDMISVIETDRTITHMPVTREEEGIGILAGAYMAGKRPVMVMQNSGLGNCMNAIGSLLGYYNIPLVFIISHRGSEGESIDAQRPMGNVAKDLLKVMSIECHEITGADKMHIVENRIKDARIHGRSVAFLFPFSFWSDPS